MIKFNLPLKSNRRKFIQNLGVGAAGLTLGSATVSLASCSSPAVGKDEDGQVLFIGDNIALAETQYGKVKGYILNNINFFLGIPYGADTSGTIFICLCRLLYEYQIRMPILHKAKAEPGCFV